MKTILLALTALCLSSIANADPIPVFIYDGSRNYNPNLSDWMAAYRFAGSPREAAFFGVSGPDDPYAEYMVVRFGDRLDFYDVISGPFPGALTEPPPGATSVSWVGSEIGKVPDTGSTVALLVIALLAIGVADQLGVTAARLRQVSQAVRGFVGENLQAQTLRCIV